MMFVEFSNDMVFLLRIEINFSFFLFYLFRFLVFRVGLVLEIDFLDVEYSDVFIKENLLVVNVFFK